MTPEECEAHGGHCWSNPLIETTPVLVQACRHCPTVRVFKWNHDRRNWDVTETVNTE